MKVVIVNCFDTYEERVDLVYDFFISNNYSVSVVQSDFGHFKKDYRKEEKKDYFFVKSKRYHKNLSIKRLASHYKFSKDAFNIVKKIEPNILYVLLPPNSLAKYSSIYKNTHNEVKLIFDIIDLWPETMPIGNAKNLLPFKFWKSLRSNGLKKADFVITECNLYQDVLFDELQDLKKETLYLAKREISVTHLTSLSENKFNLCYLGSINNIIDIEKIKEIIRIFNSIKSTTLHIIGDGENKGLLIDTMKSIGASVEYHGKIYSPQEKQNIFDKCHFGLNIMKDSVCVGLTMKSIDYFQHGLPIINNIKADTTELVEEYKVGFNEIDFEKELLSKKIQNLSVDDVIEMKKNAFRLFNEKFSKGAFNKKLTEIVDRLKDENGNYKKKIK